MHNPQTQTRQQCGDGHREGGWGLLGGGEQRVGKWGQQ